MVAVEIMPKVGDDAHPADAKALAQPVDHRQQHGDVGGVPRQHLGAERPAVAVEDDGQHHLLEVRPMVLGMAVGAQRLAAGALERQRRLCP